MKAKKIVILIAAFVLVAGLAVAGTLAWIADKTDAVVNTFTSSDINITLEETTTDYKMVPGNAIAKDPKVTVEAGSEACWLFVKIEKNASYDSYLAAYKVADGWDKLQDQDGVYYRMVGATAKDAEFTVLKDDKVTVLSTVSKSMMKNLEDGTTDKPTLTFTAYAVQQANITTAADAWTQAQREANY